MFFHQLAETITAVAIPVCLCSCNALIEGGDLDDPADITTFDTRITAASPGETETPSPVMVELEYTESDADIANPERGFYTGVDLLSPGSAAAARAQGYALALALVRLDAYRDAPLDDALLDDLDLGFADARAAGLKIILRFAYNSSFADDAPKDRILQHIEQLAPLLRANADVISVVQAGFIGAWGEWHGSTHQLDNDADRTEILTALLAAVPPTRSVQVRTPMFKSAMFDDGPTGIDEAFSETDKARVGHHNDCFLASDNDLGTYSAPVEDWMSYVADDSAFVPMGGETCRVYEPRTHCDVARAEMAAHHWTYLNRQYNQDVIDAWIAQGCEPEIRRRLGYRFFLRRVVHTETVSPGGQLALEVDIVNRGYAAPVNRRPVEVVLADAGGRWVIPVDGVDARRWAPGDTAHLSLRVRIPDDVPPGMITLALRLPDAETSLADDPAFAIAFASDGVFDADIGDNVLTRTLSIQPNGPRPPETSPTSPSPFAELR